MQFVAAAAYDGNGRRRNSRQSGNRNNFVELIRCVFVSAVINDIVVVDNMVKVVAQRGRRGGGGRCGIAIVVRCVRSVVIASI